MLIEQGVVSLRAERAVLWIDALAQEYGADRETVARDVLEFAGEASEAGLLETMPPATSAGKAGG